MDEVACWLINPRGAGLTGLLGMSSVVEAALQPLRSSLERACQERDQCQGEGGREDLTHPPTRRSKPHHSCLPPSRAPSLR